MARSLNGRPPARVRRPSGPVIDALDPKLAALGLVSEDDELLPCGGNRFSDLFRHARTKGPGLHKYTTTFRSTAWTVLFRRRKADKPLRVTAIRVNTTTPSAIEVQFGGHRKYAIAIKWVPLKRFGHFWYGHIPVGERGGSKLVRFDNRYFPAGVEHDVMVDLDPAKAGELCGMNTEYNAYSGPGKGTHVTGRGPITRVILRRPIHGGRASAIMGWLAPDGTKYRSAVIGATIAAADIFPSGQIGRERALRYIHHNSVDNYLAQ